VVFGYLSDRFGRNRYFFSPFSGTGSSPWLCIFQQHLVFIFLRFMAAVALVREYAAISSAVVEFVPKRVRGKRMLYHVIMASWSTMLSLLVMICVRFFPPELAWRAGFLMAVSCDYLHLYIRRRLPESRCLLNGTELRSTAIVAAAEKEVMERKGLRNAKDTSIIVAQG